MPKLAIKQQAAKNVLQAEIKDLFMLASHITKMR